jgi:hypothetical protein
VWADTRGATVVENGTQKVMVEKVVNNNAIVTYDVKLCVEDRICCSPTT